MTRIALAAGLLALVLVPGAAGSLQTVRVTETSFRIALSERPAAGGVRFVVRNASAVRHDLRVRGGGRTFRTPLILPGRRITLFAQLRAGVRYRIWCAVEGHAALGMERFVLAR